MGLKLLWKFPSYYSAHSVLRITDINVESLTLFISMFKKKKRAAKKGTRDLKNWFFSSFSKMWGVWQWFKEQKQTRGTLGNPSLGLWWTLIIFSEQRLLSSSLLSACAWHRGGKGPCLPALVLLLLFIGPRKLRWASQFI